MYFQGRPCRYGHTLRRLSDRHCVECSTKRNRDKQRADPESANAKNRAWRRNNLEKSRLRDRARYAREKASDPRKYMLMCARHRSKIKGIACTITLDDIVIPVRCPLLGTSLVVNDKKHRSNSPSLDRIFNAYGYVPGNITVVSYQANARKGELSSSELRIIAKNLARLERDAMLSILKR